MTLTEAHAIVQDARDEYREYAAEQRACGYEVPTFEEWCGIGPSRKEERMRVWQQRWDDDTADLY